MAILRSLLQIMILMSSLILQQIKAQAQTQAFQTDDIIQMTSQYQHKFPVNIQHQFSQQSDMSVVITSCNRLNQLQMTLNSFFHFNTYILAKMIIIEDCHSSHQGTKSEYEMYLWQLLPSHAHRYQQYFKIIINSNQNGQKIGQIGSIDKAYQYVNTRYLYHLQDDWIQISGYGLLQRMKDVLIDAQQKRWKVSQVVQTVPNWGWSHFKGPVQWTNHSTKYHQVTSYGKQWLYSFSFNPHIIDFQQLFKNQLRNSIIQSIAKRYHCLKDAEDVYMQDGGCVEHYLGVYLKNNGYKQIYMGETKNQEFKHIGYAEYQKPQIYEFQIQTLNINMKPSKPAQPQIIQQPQNTNSQAQSMTKKQDESDKTQQKNNNFVKYLIAVVIFLAVYWQKYHRTNKIKKYKRSQIPNSQSEQTEKLTK